MVQNGGYFVPRVNDVANGEGTEGGSGGGCRRGPVRELKGSSKHAERMKKGVAAAQGS